MRRVVHRSLMARRAAVVVLAVLLSAVIGFAAYSVRLWPIRGNALAAVLWGCFIGIPAAFGLVYELTQHRAREK